MILVYTSIQGGIYMHSLGISVYPDKSDIKEVYEYMETAAK